eukprot:6214737-Pleurochrysis_carterae.AAC.1
MAAASVAWAPVPEGLAQLLQLFSLSQSADNATHRDIQQQLTSFNSIPDYNSYLVYIFNGLRDEAGPVRQMAGLVLKNNVKEHWSEVHRHTCAALPDHRPGPAFQQSAATLD